MERQTFRYNCYHGEWERCDDESFVQDDIEEVPFSLLILPYKKRDVTCLIYCQEHRVFEVAEKVDEAGNVFSAAGCCIKGLLGTTNRYDADYQVVPLRWRVTHNDAGIVHVAVDSLVFSLPYVSEKERFQFIWITSAYCFSPQRRVMQVTQMKKLAGRIANRVLKTVPEPVCQAALGYLQEENKVLYQIHGGKILSRIGGVNRLLAYWERPFDLNIVYLKKFLGELVYERLFPFEEKDNYQVLCRYLGIHPTKALRKAYTFNPYAIVWRMIFKCWGIEDLRRIRPFLYRDEDFAGFRLEDLQYRPGEKEVIGANFYRHPWEPMAWFGRWLNARVDARQFAKCIRQFMGSEYQYWKWETLMALYCYEPQVSDILRAQILSEGITLEVHNVLSEEVLVLTGKYQEVHFLYEPEIWDWECVIDGYAFRVVHSTQELRETGMLMHNCVGNYRGDVLGRKVIIVTMSHAGRCDACMEIRESTIMQAKGPYNQPLDERKRLLCQYWGKIKRLTIDTDDLELEDAALKGREFLVQSFDSISQKHTEEMRLDEMLAAWDLLLARGDFLAIVQRLLAENLKTVAPPSWKRFSSETEYIQYVFPAGMPILQAAQNGQCEAQAAMAMLYQYGVLFPADPARAKAWRQRAFAGKTGIKNFHDVALAFAVERLRARKGKGMLEQI